MIINRGGAWELWGLAATQIPPYGNLMALVCRGVAIKRGSPLDIESIFRVGERCLHTDAP